MGNIFFIADTHFRGRFMLNYYERSFGVALNSTEHYDRVMIKKWNTAIRKNDRVYVIGDFADGPHTKGKDISLLCKLNGIKTLVIGTHDLGFSSRDFWYHGAIDKDLVKKYWLEVGFDRVSFDRQEIEYDGIKIVMTHERTIVPNGEVNVYGHNHDVPGDNGKYHNVSVPVTNFRPIRAAEIVKLAKEAETERINKDQQLFREKYGDNIPYDQRWRSKDFVPAKPYDYYVFPVYDYSKEKTKENGRSDN